jgi:hypothetical protein
VCFVLISKYLQNVRETALARKKKAGLRTKFSLQFFRTNKKCSICVKVSYYQNWLRSFTFPIPCITIHLSQFKPTIAHDFIKVTILQHASCCMFRPSLAHRQGAHSCKIQFYTTVCSVEKRSSWRVVILWLQ